MDEQKLRDFAKKLDENFDLGNMKLPKEYFYANLPLCVLDAIYSIGVRYTSTENTVRRYYEAFHITPYRDSAEFPAEKEQHTMSQLKNNIQNVGIEAFVGKKYLNNMQRTSSRNGILKAEAVLACAELFAKNGIETLQDFAGKWNPEIEAEYLKICGQKSGISLAYLKMLCGDDTKVKPDRHILRYLKSEYSANVELADAQPVIEATTKILNEKYPTLTVRQVDYLIWEHMRGQK